MHKPNTSHYCAVQIIESTRLEKCYREERGKLGRMYSRQHNVCIQESTFPLFHFILATLHRQKKKKVLFFFP